MSEEPRVVVLGGGTGSYEVLLGLKAVTSNLTAIVNMCDDGGSTGRLRRDYGVLAPGDIRQCLVALSTYPAMARLFSYRFGTGELTGHSLGNIILTALEKQASDYMEAIALAADMLRIVGKVLPVSTTYNELAMQDGDEIIHGQESVRLHAIHSRNAVKVWLEPETTIDPVAATAIAEADLVVIAPGGLYWTLLPILSTKGMAEALRSTRAKVMVLADLMNRPAQHAGWHVVDYVKEMEKYLGENTIDTVLYNTASIAPETLARYTESGEETIKSDPERFNEINPLVTGVDLVAGQPAIQDPADIGLRRTLIRHDSQKTAAAIRSVIAEL